MANKKLRVAAGHYHLFHRVAPTIAKAKGYFSAEGLEVEISATGTDTKSLEALIKGDIDVVVDLKTPVALRGRDRGEEVFLLGGFLNAYPGILAGAREIRTVGDLKGKRIGIREPNGVQLTLSSMILRKAGLDPERDVIFVPHTGASSFSSIAPRLEGGEMQARIAHKAYVDDFCRAGYSILADLAEYLPHGYQLRAIAARGSFLERNGAAVAGYLKATIRAYHFMKETKNHPQMMEIIKSSDLKFEQDMDQGMWEEEYPLISALPADGSINVKGLEIIVEEEKSAGRISPAMSAEKILRLDFVQQAFKEASRLSLV